MRTGTTAGFTLLELMIVLVIVGVLAALAVPSFSKLRGRAMRSEAKSNLRSLYTAQVAYYQEKDTYTPLVREVGFRPERGNRYAYLLEAGGPLETRNAATVDESGASTFTGYQPDVFAHPGAVPDPSPLVGAHVEPGALGWFTAVAAGNVDRQADLDEWSVSSRSRVAGAVSDATATCAEGDAVAGEACLDVSDL